MVDDSVDEVDEEVENVVFCLRGLKSPGKRGLASGKVTLIRRLA